MSDLKGKNAVITGAGSGIGQAIAIKFAERGANVLVVDRDENAAKETQQKIKQFNGESEVWLTDISSHQTIVEGINKWFKKWGHLDILVNNAGIAHVGNVEKTSEEDLDRLYSVNVKGVYNMIYACIPHMLSSGSGAILNLSSIAAKLGIADRFAYSMTKGAVLSMTLSVAKDYVKQGIRCNCICPARVHTPFVDGYLEKNYPDNKEEMFKTLSEYQPMGRMGSPEEIANLALFLCSDQSAFTTGSAYDIDGGVTLLR